MQPTYLPWVGYFALMAAVDVFVFLDDVQFDRRSWQQRNRIRTPAGIQWLSVPVRSKGARDQRIVDVRLDRVQSFGARHLRTLEHAYGRTPFFSTWIDRLTPWLAAPPERLADLTIGLIATLADGLDITTPTHRASDLNATGHRADRLVSLCRAVGADTYLSPPGAESYLAASDSFARAGLPYDYFAYDHPVWDQGGGRDFVSHLSVVDLLFHHGPDAGAIMRSGLRPVVMGFGDGGDSSSP